MIIITAYIKIRKGSTIMNTIKVNAGKTMMVAHRGVSGLERENTVAAFLAAGNRSYYGIETDFHRTADGKFIGTVGVDLVDAGLDQFGTQIGISPFAHDAPSFLI